MQAQNLSHNASFQACEKPGLRKDCTTKTRD